MPRRLTYVARYKFTLCFYHDCYYFLIKRYCAPWCARSRGRAAVLARANDVERRVNEARAPLIAPPSLRAPLVLSYLPLYRNDPFVLLVDT